jgi:hypothetical protein
MNDLNSVQKEFNAILLHERKNYINSVLESFYLDLLNNGISIEDASKEIENFKKYFFKNDLKI